MSGGSSPVNGGYEAARLTVRKDLFPNAALHGDTTDTSDDEMISSIKLETDFEQSIDEIAIKKQQLIANGMMSSPPRSRHKKRKQRSRKNSERSNANGCLPPEKKRKKRSRHSRTHSNSTQVLKVQSGKNLNLVSSSEFPGDDDDDEDEGENDVEAEEKEAVPSSSDDEVLKCSVKLPLINMTRQSGKPYSHELSQLSTKKRKKEKEKKSKEKHSHAIIPCSGKPRSMLDICSHSKKKSKKSEVNVATYRSQIVDTNIMKIKIRRTGVHETRSRSHRISQVSPPHQVHQVQLIPAPAPTSISDLGQRKCKKKRAASPVASESSGEEYDPSRGDTAAAMSVAAPKPRHPKTRTRKPTTKSKDKREKTERSRVSAASEDNGPQSPWGSEMPNEILLKIFENVVTSQGSLPSAIRMGRVCKLWHSISCSPELWKNVDLAQYTTDKCKTDYKLVWLLENRLSKCQSLNIAQWKVCNISWVLACVVDYCPGLVELSLAGWSRITPDQLFDLLQGLPKLQRIDLSLTSETGGSSTCLSAASMARVADTHGARLTHLTLANNKYTALPQILSSIAANCQNLEVLDISGALATSHPAAIPLEALQKGCPKLRVFRAANSQLVLASATTAQQMEVEGWSQLEELSIAGEAAAELIGEYRLGDDALSRLVRGATRLRLLDLRGLQRLTDSGLVRVPAWDLQHLFLGGCNVTRQRNACLELICEKWSHSLIELDLSWACAARVLDDAVSALADCSTSRLKTLNLCGSSVSLEPVKKVLLKCSQLESINLSSCRALPRGMKRLYTGKELQDLKDSLDPVKLKAKEAEKDDAKKGKDVENTEADSKPEAKESNSTSLESPDSKIEPASQDKSSSFLFQEPKSIVSPGPTLDKNASSDQMKTSPDSKSELSKSTPEGKRSRSATPKLLSPLPQSRPDSSSTPRSDPSKLDHNSPHYSPVPKPDSQVQNSPDVHSEVTKTNSWNMGYHKTTPTHKSEASPLNRLDSKLKHGKIIEQCSPTTSLENKRSPETLKQDIKNPNNWNYGNYSPMPRPESQFSSQRSPYSAQPSPAQPSPYSTQPSPYSTQPSPYSSQPSPYSAQPSPDTSQIVKPELQKSGPWNPGNYSPMPKHPQFSPHPSTHTSPDPGVGLKGESLRSNPSRTPGQYSPMSRQDRIHQSPYSPRPSVDNAYGNKKSPGMGNYSPMMRPDCHLPSPDPGVASRSVITGRTSDLYGRAVSKAPEMIQTATAPEVAGHWGSIDRFSQICNTAQSAIESLGWGVESFTSEPSAPPPQTQTQAQGGSLPSMLSTPPPQAWPGLPPFGTNPRRPNQDLRDPWTIGQYREEPPHQGHNTFVEQNISFESLRPHLGHSSHTLQSYLDDFTESSRVE